jgi:hypothetical protein
MMRARGQAARNARPRAASWLLGVGLCLGAVLVTGAPARSLPPGYVGDEVCAGCHEDLLPHYRATIHA